MEIKVFVILAIFVGTTFAVEKLSKQEEEKIVEIFFQNFPKTRNGRSWRNGNAKENILRHYYEVQEHNERYRAGEETFQMELNEFSVTNDEILASTKLGFADQSLDELIIHNSNDTTVLVDFKATSSSLPDYWNWAEHGIVQPVQDQGGCGSCYAFAAIGVIESSMCRFNGCCVKLSEQEAMECTTGCRGGWDTTVYAYANSHGGCTSSSYYSYLGYVRNQCDTKARPRAPFSQSYNYKILPNDAEVIRQFLYDYGPLFVAFDVYNNLFSYSSGIVTTTPGSRAGGHAGYFRVIRGVNFARIESWKVSFAWTK